MVLVQLIIQELITLQYLNLLVMLYILLMYLLILILLLEINNGLILQFLQGIGSTSINYPITFKNLFCMVITSRVLATTSACFSCVARTNSNCTVVACSNGQLWREAYYMLIIGI